ncbi:hypothetical protein SDC9_183512 [bioreactor metagenome]|uniref:Uncharacterized protein n=1 Tax=bioreactor metagenome TaxID=1076179 RepID=A0A645HAE7_9ZZZZ
MHLRRFIVTAANDVHHHKIAKQYSHTQQGRHRNAAAQVGHNDPQIRLQFARAQQLGGLDEPVGADGVEAVANAAVHIGQHQHTVSAGQH